MANLGALLGGIGAGVSGLGGLATAYGQRDAGDEAQRNFRRMISFLQDALAQQQQPTEFEGQLLSQLGDLGSSPVMQALAARIGASTQQAGRGLAEQLGRTGANRSGAAERMGAGIGAAGNMQYQQGLASLNQYLTGLAAQAERSRLNRQLALQQQLAGAIGRQPVFQNNEMGGFLGSMGGALSTAGQLAALGGLFGGGKTKPAQQGTTGGATTDSGAMADLGDQYAFLNSLRDSGVPGPLPPASGGNYQYPHDVYDYSPPRSGGRRNR